MVILRSMLVVFLVSSCASIQNFEGKIFDASSIYCRDLRANNPVKYVEECESIAAWEKRAPDEYKDSIRNRSFSEGVVDSVFDSTIDALFPIDDKDIHSLESRPLEK